MLPPIYNNQLKMVLFSSFAQHNCLKMKSFPPTIIVRHRRENLKKCSLRGLEGRSDFLFFRYPLKQVLPCENYVLLSLDAEKELSHHDHQAGLLILDSTWRYAETMMRNIAFPNSVRKKRLPPNIQTAYPRRQEDCSDPSKGLASIEAIVSALIIMGRSIDGLLDHYHWKDSFVEKNRPLLLP